VPPLFRRFVVERVFTVKIEVRPSRIHGLGVFAKKRIVRRERIGSYLARPTRRNGAYVLWVEDEGIGTVQGYNGFGRLRYLNHSMEPNSAFDGLELFALRPIRPGEEITIHYGDEWSHQT
jgi:hypothetical protein